jgi:predicted transglutaminase-like cysteine proteinase
MLARQQQMMQDPQDAARFKTFLSQFDTLKGKPLPGVLQEVNNIVNNALVYESENKSVCYWDGCYKNYWQAPLQSILRGKGDCKDYATLKYAVLRYLDVPEKDLFIAVVNTDGNNSVSNHAVLIVNTAKKGSNFIMLDSILSNGINYDIQTSKSKYILFDVMNPASTWVVNPVTYLERVIGPSAINQIKNFHFRVG